MDDAEGLNSLDDRLLGRVELSAGTCKQCPLAATTLLHWQFVSVGVYQ